MALLKLFNETTKQWESVPAIIGPRGEKGDKGDAGTTNYTELTNLPSINGTTLKGNVSLPTSSDVEKAITSKGYQTEANVKATVEGYGYATTTEVDEKADKVLVDDTETSTEIEIIPNKYYQLGEKSELYISLAEPTETDILNEYMLEFISGTTATTFTYDVTSITFVSEPTIEANMLYQISIVNGLAVIAGVAYESEEEEATE